MSSAISESATWETAVIAPDGTDPRTAASLRTPLQDLANRTKFLKEGFVNVQSLIGSTADTDYNNTTFATLVDGTLSFSGAKVGDKIVLYSDTHWETSGAMTADGSDPFVRLRWLVGATDLSVVAGDYPGITWGHSIPASATDRRCVSVGAVYTVVADGTVTANLQGKFSSGFVALCAHSQLIGTHYRLGA